VAVRTSSLALGISAATIATQTLYTVPSGARAIVKSIRLTNNGAVPHPIGMRVLRGATTVAVWDVTIPAASGVYLEQLFVVLDAGDALRIQRTVAAAVQYVISGTQLALA